MPSLHDYTLSLCLATLVLITIVNLRGMRESGLIFSVPTWFFVATLALVVGWGIIKTFASGGHPHPDVAPPPIPTGTETLSLWLMLRAFASGCTAMTGVEAVSNAVNAFEKPAVERAQRTLTLIVVILGVLLAGIAFVSRAFGVWAMDGSDPAYQSMLSQLTAAVAGRGVVYYVTMGSVIAVLMLSANTSFAGFPRLCRLISADNYLPHAFANRGRRLVYSLGIVALAIIAALLLVAFGGITDRLIPLFAIGAFLAFTLSQAGMVAHWRRVGGRGSSVSFVINLVGCVATAAALSVILVAKFTEGAWITVLLIPALLWLFSAVKRHYAYVAHETALERVLDLSNLTPPIVVVPMHSVSSISERALRFAMRISRDVIALNIAADEEESEQLRQAWERQVAPAQPEGTTLHLVTISSPFRLLFRPLVEFIDQMKAEHPDRIIAVVIPELIERHWWENFLHKQRAEGLKSTLLRNGSNRVVVVNTPWNLGAHAERC